MGIVEKFEYEYHKELENAEWEYIEHKFERDKQIEKLKNNLKLNIMTKSKVEKIQETKPWNGANGTVFYHSLIMDNGDKINIGKKKELAIGDELNYEIIDTGQEFNKAKSVMENPQTFGGGKKEDYVKGIEVGHAVNNAVNLICAGTELDIKECNSTEEKIYESAKVIMAIAHRLKNEI